MKIRTLYFKTTDLAAAKTFWQSLLSITPHKDTLKWAEFMVGDLRLGILLNDFGDQVVGCNCVPVFEFPDAELPAYIGRAQQLGAKVLVDGLNDPNLLSMVMADPFGNEFELSKFHE
jgi:predicted enzyme related to lactoylglutathione lyase